VRFQLSLCQPLQTGKYNTKFFTTAQQQLLERDRCMTQYLLSDAVHNGATLPNLVDVKPRKTLLHLLAT